MSDRRSRANTVSRRQVVRMLAALPVTGFALTPAEAAGLHRRVRSVQGAEVAAGFEPAFFSPHEYATVRLLVDLIIPADERSGSATAAGVPEFIDFMMIDRPSLQVPMRGGLAWLDYEAQVRFDRRFLDGTSEARTAMLDEIAWPSRSRPELSHGVTFFNSFRDLTASGFWSSRMGVEDLQYQGNRFLSSWQGCPSAVLEHLGLESDP